MGIRVSQQNLSEPETFNLNLNPKKKEFVTIPQDFDEFRQMGSKYRQTLNQYFVKENMVRITGNHSEKINSFANIQGDFLAPDLKSDVIFRILYDKNNLLDFQRDQKRDETFISSKNDFNFKNTDFSVYASFGNRFVGLSKENKFHFGLGLKAKRDFEIYGKNTSNCLGLYYNTTKKYNFYLVSKTNDKLTVGVQHKNEKKPKSKIQMKYLLKNSEIQGEYDISKNNFTTSYYQRLYFPRTQWFSWLPNGFQWYDHQFYIFSRQPVHLENTIDLAVKMNFKSNFKFAAHWQLNYDQSVKIFTTSKKLKLSYIHQIFPNIDFVVTLHSNYNDVYPMFGLFFNSYQNHEPFE